VPCCKLAVVGYEMLRNERADIALLLYGALWTFFARKFTLCKSNPNTTNTCRSLSHWDRYSVISLEAVAYSSYGNTVKWFWWD